MVSRQGQHRDKQSLNHNGCNKLWLIMLQKHNNALRSIYLFFILFLIFYFLHLGASGTSAVQVAVVRYNHARVGHVQLYACCGIF